MTQQSQAIEVEQGHLQPVQPRQRIRELDALRGFAIFGIFMVNIGFFAGPMVHAIMPGAMGQASPGETVSHIIVRSLFELKFVSLFSMMFGMGMVIQLMRAEQAREPFVPMYLRRIFVLGVFGFIHAFFWWYGDILFLYAWTALIGLLFVRMPAKTLATMAVIALTMAVLSATAVQVVTLSGTFAAEPAEAPTPDAGIVATPPVQADERAASDTAVDSTESDEQTPVEELFALIQQMDEEGGDFTSDSWLQAEDMAYARGPMSVTLIMRAMTYVAMLAFGIIIGGFGFRLIGMFLLGMALFKWGLFDDERRESVKRMCRICLPLGLAGEAIAVTIGASQGFAPGWYTVGVEALHWTASVVLAIGYLSGMVLLYRSGAVRLLMLGLEGVGRTALSNYLLQTLISTTAFYWWGFGLFGTMSRPAQLLMVLGVFLGQMIVTFMWLRMFRMGPIEWLWRTLTYLKAQRMVR